MFNDLYKSLYNLFSYASMYTYTIYIVHTFSSIEEIEYNFLNKEFLILFSFHF